MYEVIVGCLDSYVAVISSCTFVAVKIKFNSSLKKSKCMMCQGILSFQANERYLWKVCVPFGSATR